MVGDWYVDDDRYTKDEDAFLYTIRKKNPAWVNEEYKPSMYWIKSTETDYALYYAKDFLCNFGYGESDIWIEQICNKTRKNNGKAQYGYNVPIGILTSGGGALGYGFRVNAMEVYRLSY